MEITDLVNLVLIYFLPFTVMLLSLLCQQAHCRTLREAGCIDKRVIGLDVVNRSVTRIMTECMTESAS